MKLILLLPSILFLCFSNLSFSQGDDCSTATQLTSLGNYCSSGGAFTNATATVGTFARASCWTSTTQTTDVWFKFVSVGTDLMIIVKGSGISTGATLKSASIALYTGDCSTGLSESKCTMSTSSNTTSLYQGGMSLGVTYLVRITTTSGNKGKFDLCINNFNPVQNINSPNDCDKGTIICNKDAISVGLLASYGSNTTEHQLPGSCMTSPEANSTWLEFKCSTTGTLDFDISGTDITNDIDWILMEIPSMRNCITRTLVSCNIASCTLNGATTERKTGLRPGENAAALIGSGVTDASEPGGCSSPANGYNNSVTISAGKTYALFLNNFTGVQGYSLSWGGTSKFQGPEVAITTDKSTICIGESIQTNGSTSTAGTYITLDWTLPSVAVPTTYSGVGPYAVTFNKTGTYPIILKGTDAQGCINVVNKNITVNGLNADFTAPPVCVGSTTTFTCGAAGISSYAWNYGDGSNGTGVTSSHTYATAGDYAATLTVVGGGCTNVITQNVSVLGAALTITPATPNICPGNSTALNGTALVTGNVSKSKVFTQSTAVTVPKAGTYGVPSSWDGTFGSGANSVATTYAAASNLAVTGLSTTNWKINFININISTTRPKNSLIFIETPCGQRIKLVDYTSAISGSNFTDTKFSATATTIVGSAGNTTAPFTATYAADDFTNWNSKLLGCTNPNGTWKLIVGEYEYGASGTPSITNWTIDFQTDVANTLKTLVWSPLTNLSGVAYTGFGSTSGTSTATTSTAETITLNATDENNCVSTKNVTVIVGGPVAPTVAPVNYCQNATATALTATGASLLWYTAATGGVGSATAPTPLTTTAVTTSYYVSQTSGGCESTRSKLDVIVSTRPVLSITNPSAVCSPLTVNLALAAVTAGSTGAGTLSYWTDNAATTSLTTSSAVTTSNTYYIKSTAGTCTDIKPVIVTINNCACPVVLTITDPTAVCSPLTVDVTLPAVTTGSSSPSTLSYWTNSICTTLLTTSTAITLTGVYYIKSDDGTCSVIKPVNVTVNTTPSLVVVNPSAVCSPTLVDITLPAVTTGSTGNGTLTYWSDNTYTTALTNSTAVSFGTYYIKSTIGTCTDSKAVSVTVNSTPVLTITDPNGACPPSTVSIISASVTAGSTGGGSLTYWNDLAGTSVVSNPSTISASGTFYIKATNTTCTDVKAVNVTISAPVLSITNPLAVCSPLTVDVTLPAVTTGSTGNGIVTYFNEIGCTTVLPNPTSVAVGTTYYIKSTAGICSDVKAVTVTINTTPSLTITDPAAVCEPNTVDISSASITAGSTGGGIRSFWTNVSATNALTNQTAISTSGVYYIKSTNGVCSDTKAVTVTVNATPSLIVINPASVCFPSTVDITKQAVTNGSTGNGALSYSLDAAGTIPLSNEKALAVNGTYYIKSSIGSCVDIKPVTITINSSPILLLEEPLPVCEPAKLDITGALTTAGSTPGTLLTYWTNTSATVRLNNPTAIGIQNTYYIQSTLNGCSSISPIFVQINPKPIADFKMNPSVISTANPISQMENTSIDAVNSSWLFNDGGISSETSPSHTFPDKVQSQQNIILIVTSVEGCKDTTSRTITINEELIYYVPNSFTPDEDDYNQEFRPVFTSGYDPSVYHLMIFNRWGTVVFESSDVNYGWGGKYGKDGTRAQEGSYTWKITYKLKMNDLHKSIVGSVNLLK